VQAAKNGYVVEVVAEGEHIPAGALSYWQAWSFMIMLLYQDP